MNQTKLSDGLQTVYVVDDGDGAREIGSALEAAGRRVEVFPSTELFLSACRSDWTGCLIVDTAVRGMGGLRLQAELNRRGCLLPVIMTTAGADVGVAVAALLGGAIDFIQKPIDQNRFLDRVDAAFALDNRRRQLERLRRAASDRLARLTRREREVMALVVAGKANKVVAYELGISEKTVESHRARLMWKLEVQSLPDLVRLEWHAVAGELRQ
jgi:FixJ family two-component response regulator